LIEDARKFEAGDAKSANHSSISCGLVLGHIAIEDGKFRPYAEKLKRRVFHRSDLQLRGIPSMHFVAVLDEALAVSTMSSGLFSALS